MRHTNMLVIFILIWQEIRSENLGPNSQEEWRESCPTAQKHLWRGVLQASKRCRLHLRGNVPGILLATPP
jgi:hypothetical protein